MHNAGRQQAAPFAARERKHVAAKRGIADRSENRNL